MVTECGFILQGTARQDRGCVPGLAIDLVRRYFAGTLDDLGRAAPIILQKPVLYPEPGGLASGFLTKISHFHKLHQ
jgi:hypothetical protein